jgi:hypothetical protein
MHLQIVQKTVLNPTYNTLRYGEDLKVSMEDIIHTEKFIYIYKTNSSTTKNRGYNKVNNVS